MAKPITEALEEVTHSPDACEDFGIDEEKHARAIAVLRKALAKELEAERESERIGVAINGVRLTNIRLENGAKVTFEDAEGRPLVLTGGDVLELFFAYAVEGGGLTMRGGAVRR